MTNRVFGLLVLICIGYQIECARADSGPFHFETIVSLGDMHRFIETQFPSGSPQDALRKTFVTEGKATLKTHPTQPGVEKYIYDINLCSYYIWRWNISADYDGNRRLLQAYVNGEPIFSGGTQKKDPNQIAKAASGKKASIYKMFRPRPEAIKGEKALAFILLDSDSDLHTIDDQLAIGAGPSSADPVNMGKLIVYQNVEPWRSIFDFDEADRIHQYPGDCTKADEAAAQAKGNGHP